MPVIHWRPDRVMTQVHFWKSLFPIQAQHFDTTIRGKGTSTCYRAVNCTSCATPAYPSITPLKQFTDTAACTTKLETKG